MSDEVNEVTQADIDAAEEHYPPLFWKKAARDDLALAFARYRTAFQASAGECRSNQAAYEELRRFAQNIFNGLDTSMIRMDTPADETLANVLRRGRAALATLTTPVEASQPVGDAGEAMSKRTFLTCVSGDGPQPYLKVHFNNLADAHAAHDELLGRKGES